MINFEAMPATGFNDAELVAESLSGNRDAFRQIVERYQTLISSLGYSATGNVALSEDLAQETFVTAWKRLAKLREPAKLRAWLCGINRFLVSKEFRRLGKEPVHAAESLEAVQEWSSPEPLPPDHAISDEEKAILWRSIERIPEIYRETLILFYREHQSVEAVARSLDLGEDAVKQRLSRGRKLLHQQVLGFVEAALERTKPDRAFAVGVLAALPLVTTTAKAAAAGVAIKGGSSVKAATSFAMFGAVLTGGVLFLFSLIGFVAFTGGCIGYMMSRACRRSARDMERVIACWRMLSLGFLGIVGPAMLASEFIPKTTWCHSFFHGTTFYLWLIYPGVLLALLIWIARWWRGLHHADAVGGVLDHSMKKRFATWLTAGLLVPGVLCTNLVCHMLFWSTWNSQSVSSVQAQQMFTSRKDAEVNVQEYQNGAKTIWIKLPESHRQVAYFATADEPMLAALAQSGISYKTSIEGRDFVGVGLTWHGLVFLSIFVASMGGLVLAGRPWQQRMFVRREAEVERDERAARRTFKALAVSVAMVMLGVGLVIGLVTRWGVHTVSLAALPGLLADSKYADYEVFQYSNGTRELWVCQAAHKGHPDFIVPIGPATLAMLTDRGISYTTYVQGKDFGMSMPKPVVAFFAILLLVGSGGIILFSVSPKFLAGLGGAALIAVGITIAIFTPWRMSVISAPAGRVMIADHPNYHFSVCEFTDGSRQVWIAPHHRGHWYNAPADEATLALLTEKNIRFRTMIQGRDFGYAMPTRTFAVSSITGLVAAAGFIVWLAWRKKKDAVDAVVVNA